VVFAGACWLASGADLPFTTTELRDHRGKPAYQVRRERLAILEVSNGHTLVRCGAAAGADILLRYLTDARRLASQARQELTAMGAGDFRAVPVGGASAVDRFRAAVRPHPVPPDTSRPISGAAQCRLSHE
jgi:hypothetical protein